MIVGWFSSSLAGEHVCPVVPFVVVVAFSPFEDSWGSSTAEVVGCRLEQAQVLDADLSCVFPGRSRT